MGRTALYCRVSTANQSKGLEAQEHALLNFCKANSIEDYVIFRDENVSGTKQRRPGLDQLMTAARAGQVVQVVVPAFSRFARNTRHLIEVLEEFKQLEVTFVSLSEHIDTRTPTGKAMFTIFSAIAELERDLISERVKGGLENARAKGIELGRPRTRPSSLIIELWQKGLNYRQIADVAKCSKSTVWAAVKEHKERSKSRISDD